MRVTVCPLHCSFNVSWLTAGNNWRQALQYYNAAIQHNKFYVEAYCNVGVIYKNVGQLEAAITFYDKVRARGITRLSARRVVGARRF
jgi:tetratricopeptide (TPR) repeat protein